MESNGDIQARFGKRVRLLRVMQEISQETLALECELDQSYVSSIERGKRNVSLRSIQSIARALGVTLSQLFDGMEQPIDNSADTLTTRARIA